MTRAPDILTSSRGVIAVLIVALGFAGQRALAWVVFLTMIGWTTDILDGRIARRQHKGPTWIGEHEFTFDMVMVFAAFYYLVMTGFVPVLPAVVYATVSALFIIVFNSKSVTMLFAFPLVALLLIVAYYRAPHAAYIYIVWIVLALIYDWRRFFGVVREFLINARELYHRFSSD